MSKKKLALLALLCTVLWGSAIPVIKYGYSLWEITTTGGRLFSAAVRFTTAGALLLLWYGLRHKTLREKGILKSALPLGFIQTGLQYFLLYEGTAHTTSVKSSMMNGVGTLVAILLSELLFHKRIGIRVLLCGLLGAAGIVILFYNGSSLDISLLGDGLIFLSVVSFAVGFVMSKVVVKGHSVILLTGYQLFFGGICLFAAAIAYGHISFRITLAGVLVMAYLIAVSSIAFSIWTHLLDKNDMNSVTIFNFCVPLFGVLISYGMSAAHLIDPSHTVLANTVLSLLLICFSILLLHWTPHFFKRGKEPEQDT